MTCLQSVNALKLGLEKLERRKPELLATAAATTAGVDDEENSTNANRSNDPADGGTHPPDTHREDDRSSLSPPPFPPSPRRFSPSPTSPAEFKGYLDHLPEMNLPWQPLRSVTRCACGRAFTFLVSKVSPSTSYTDTHQPTKYGMDKEASFSSVPIDSPLTPIQVLQAHQSSCPCLSVF